jgi:hypothetical protein
VTPDIATIALCAALAPRRGDVIEAWARRTSGWSAGVGVCVGPNEPEHAARGRLAVELYRLTDLAEVWPSEDAAHQPPEPTMSSVQAPYDGPLSLFADDIETERAIVERMIADADRAASDAHFALPEIGGCVVGQGRPIDRRTGREVILG